LYEARLRTTIGLWFRSMPPRTTIGVWFYHPRTTVVLWFIEPALMPVTRMTFVRAFMVSLLGCVVP